MNRKAVSKLIVFLLILFFILILVFGGLLVFMFKGHNYDGVYEKRVVGGELINPVGNLTKEEAIERFDKSFVYYILFSIKAYNLHESPLSNDKPRIEFYIDEDSYSAVIDEGEINVNDGLIDNEDVIFRTTKAEVVEMINDKDYIRISFQNKGSSIELVAGKTKLASKGYTRLYEEIMGNGAV